MATYPNLDYEQLNPIQRWEEEQAGMEFLEEALKSYEARTPSPPTYYRDESIDPAVWMILGFIAIIIMAKVLEPMFGHIDISFKRKEGKKDYRNDKKVEPEFTSLHRSIPSIPKSKLLTKQQQQYIDHFDTYVKFFSQKGIKVISHRPDHYIVRRLADDKGGLFDSRVGAVECALKMLNML